MTTRVAPSRPSMGHMSMRQSSVMTPNARRRQSGNDIAGDVVDVVVGDTVDVPGGMDGKVKFVGEVRGKPGLFVGVELSQAWASRGKNSGDAEGVRYFSTSTPGAGIFLPIHRATRRPSPTTSVDSTPLTPSFERNFIRQSSDAPIASTPTPIGSTRLHAPTSQARAASPTLKARSRPSLPRPESPLRRPQARPPSTTPGGRQSLNMLAQNRLHGPRYAPSPTPAKGPSKAAMTPRTTATPSARSRPIPTNDDEDEIARLKAVIQEKNEKIASLTAEFDSHRADFRSTLDTLDLASTETERVYEKKVEDLMEERRILLAQAEDVDIVAQQFHQLEEVVQELEEGLEDARRLEAEARGEAEFLRGEVERVRAELEREREQNAQIGRRPASSHREPSSLPDSRAPSTNRLTSSAQPVESRTVHPSAEESSALGAPLSEPTKASSPPRKIDPTFHAKPRSLALLDDSTRNNVNKLHVSSPPITQVNESTQKPNGLKESPQKSNTIAAPPLTNGDADKWCALCEQDGHDSINCPLDQF